MKVVSFKLWLLYHFYPLDGRWVGPRNDLDIVKKRESLPLLVSEPPTP
jgi:hypothetical protein